MDDTFKVMKFALTARRDSPKNRFFRELWNWGKGFGKNHVLLERFNSGSVKKFGILPMKCAR